MAEGPAGAGTEMEERAMKPRSSAVLRSQTPAGTFVLYFTIILFWEISHKNKEEVQKKKKEL